MKQTLLFLQKDYLRLAAILLVAATILLGGCWVTRTQEDSNLFYIYLGMFPVVCMMIPVLLGFSMRYHLELCLGFGALRKNIFVAIQLLNNALLGFCLLLCVGLSLASEGLLPAEKLFGLAQLTQPAELLLTALTGVALVQGGLCMGRLRQNKVLWACFVLGFGFYGAYSGIRVSAGVGQSLGIFQPSSPWYWVLCGALLLSAALLAAVAWRLYRRAVVTV